MTRDDQAKLRALAEAATQGPWRQGMVSGRCHKPSHSKGAHSGPRGTDPCVYDYKIVCDDELTECYVAVEPNVTLIASDDNGPILSRENAAFIAAANPAAVLSLLDDLARIRRLAEEACDLANDVINEFYDDNPAWAERHAPRRAAALGRIRKELSK